MVGRAGENQYQWYHATSYEGMIGILKEGIILPTCLETMFYRKDLKEGKPPWNPKGFFGAAAIMHGAPHAETDLTNHLKKLINRYLPGKRQHGLTLSGIVWGTHKKIHEGGTWAEQKAMASYRITHNQKEKRWCLYSATSHIHAIHLAHQHTEPPPNHGKTTEKEEPPPNLIPLVWL